MLGKEKAVGNNEGGPGGREMTKRGKSKGKMSNGKDKVRGKT